MSALNEHGRQHRRERRGVGRRRRGREGRAEPIEDEVDPLDDGGPRPAAATKKEADRPHRRSGAHVSARDGRGRAAQPRGRDRHRQAHRGRPRHDDLGPVRKPDHLQRDHRLVQRAQRRPHAAARDPRSRRDAVQGPDRRAATRRGRRRRRARARSARRPPAPRSRKRKRSPTSPRPSRRRRRGHGRAPHRAAVAEEEDEDNTLVARPDGRDAQAPGAREIRDDHLALQEILQGPGAPHGRASPPAAISRRPTRRSTRSCARS